MSRDVVIAVKDLENTRVYIMPDLNNLTGTGQNLKQIAELTGWDKDRHIKEIQDTELYETLSTHLSI